MSGVQSPRARADLLAAGASIKGAARKFAIDYHALRRHWRNHVSAEARAAYIAGAGATKDQLEEIHPGRIRGSSGTVDVRRHFLEDCHVSSQLNQHHQ